MTALNRLKQHSLVASLLELRGNARACVYTEPLFGIPYNLYMPFFAVYMYALGLDDRMIGIVTSIGLFIQIFTAIFGGIITDRLGRKRATFIFDTFSWSLSLLIWTFAQDYRWFIVAAIINAFNQVPNNSWTCLLVEDAEPRHILHMYTWVNLSGQFAVFFAPLSGLLVNALGVVPAMRILLFFAFVSLTSKFIILNVYATETSVGRERMEATRSESYLSQLTGYRRVLSEIWRTPRTRLLLFIFVILNMTTIVSNNYLSLYLTLNVGLPEAVLPIFPMVRAAIMLLFLFGFQRIISRFSYRAPLLFGLALCAISQGLLTLSPQMGLLVLIPSIVLESVGAAIIWPQKDALQTIWVNPNERARTLSLLYVLQLALSTPFGWITGEVSQWNRTAVFVLNGALYLLCAILVVRAPHHEST